MSANYLGVLQWDGLEGDFREGPPLVPISDRGFRYGMAVFETVRVIKGHAMFWEEHLDSLVRACVETELLPPREALERLAEMPEAWAGLFEALESGIVRLHVTAGDGGFELPATDCQVIVTLEAREAPPELVLEGGLDFAIYPQPIVPLPFGENGALKTHNYWQNVAAFAWAQSQGAAEAVLTQEIDGAVEVISGCFGNLFMKMGDRWICPPEDGPDREGIVKAWVKSTWETLPDASELVEGTLNVNDLPVVSSSFMTNSWWGPVPIATLGGRALEIDPVVGQLQAIFKKM